MSELLLAKSILVDRSKIALCKFPKNEVVALQEDQQTRSRKIHMATRLGNLEQKKVNIYFNDKEGIKHVYTTIWAQTSKQIILKDNVQVPVHRILDIRMD